MSVDSNLLTTLSKQLEAVGFALGSPLHEKIIAKLAQNNTENVPALAQHHLIGMLARSAKLTDAQDLQALANAIIYFAQNSTAEKIGALKEQGLATQLTESATELSNGYFLDLLMVLDEQPDFATACKNYCTLKTSGKSNLEAIVLVKDLPSLALVPTTELAALRAKQTQLQELYATLLQSTPPESFML